MSQQVVKLGLVGFETTLPTESRVNSGFSIEEKSSTGESADGTIRKDIVSSKKVFTYSYGVVTEVTQELIESIYELQITNATTLSLKFTKQDTTEVSFTVYMDPPSFGPLIIKDIYYNNGTTLTLREAVV